MRPPPLKIEDSSTSASAISPRHHNKHHRSSTYSNSQQTIPLKPPLPAAAAPPREGPVIIHTYSPKVIQTSTQDFMELVQRLTGSADTRLRCKKKKNNAKAISKSRFKFSPPKFKSSSSKFAANNSGSIGDHQDHDVYKPSLDYQHVENHKAADHLTLSSSFKSPLLAGDNEAQHMNHPLHVGDSSVSTATPTGSSSLGWSSPIPTPNFLLQHDLFKDLPILSPLFSPAWLGR